MLPKCNELFESLRRNDQHHPDGLTLNDLPSSFGIDEHNDRRLWQVVQFQMFNDPPTAANYDERPVSVTNFFWDRILSDFDTQDWVVVV